jgi:hypothetical protein
MPAKLRAEWHHFIQQKKVRLIGKILGLGLSILVLIFSAVYFSSAPGVSPQAQDTRQQLARQTALALASLASDYDTDGTIEPIAATSDTGAYADDPQDKIPPLTGIAPHNADGAAYRYCAYDYGTIVNPSRYFTAMDANGRPATMANPAPSLGALAIIDAGLNRKFEQDCRSITLPHPNPGDDIVIRISLLELQKAASQGKASGKNKALLTCAFGQVYSWNNTRQDWICITPDAEMAQKMPAGCPKGQVLVERGKKIQCEKEEIITGNQQADLGQPEITANPNPVNAANPQPNLVSTTSATPVTLPKPRSAETAAGVVESNTQPPVDGTQNAQAGAATTIPAQTGGLAKTDAAITAMDIGDGTANAPGAQNQDVRGGNLLTNGNTDAAATDAVDTSEMAVVMRSYNRKVKFKSCNPWLYLPRSVGEVTQCIQSLPIAAGQISGRMTSWPMAVSFWRSAFMVCPNIATTIRIGCLGYSFDPKWLPQVPRQDITATSYVCARTQNPLPPPPNEYHARVGVEIIRPIAQSRCGYAQLPTIERQKTTGQNQLLCFNLNDKLQAATPDGSCDCGWSWIWNPARNRFDCS